MRLRPCQGQSVNGALKPEFPVAPTTGDYYTQVHTRIHVCALYTPLQMYVVCTC